MAARTARLEGPSRDFRTPKAPHPASPTDALSRMERWRLAPAAMPVANATAEPKGRVNGEEEPGKGAHREVDAALRPAI